MVGQAGRTLVDLRSTHVPGLVPAMTETPETRHGL